MRASLAAGFRWALGPLGSSSAGNSEVAGRRREVNEKPNKRSSIAASKTKVKDVKDEGGTEDLLEQAWCQQCQRHDFGRFCPTCGQCLVHEVVTPTGHWRLGSTDRSLVKVKQENSEPPTLVTRAVPPRNSPEAEPATPLSSPCSDGSVSDLPLKEEPLSTPREKRQASQRYSDDESTGLEQEEPSQSPAEELTPSEEMPEESVPEKNEQKCEVPEVPVPEVPHPRRGMLSMLRPEKAVEAVSPPEMPKKSKECKELPCSPRPKGRFLAFVAKRRHTQRGTPQRFPLVATAKPCTAMVPMSPPLRLGKVLRMPKKRLRRKQKAEMTEVPAMKLSEFMGECPCEVFQVFRNFEATNGTEPSGALARLKAAREVHGAAALQEALQCCAEAILCCGDCRSSFVLVDACIDLLGTAAHEVESAPGLLGWLVQRLGGEAKALRDRPARQRAASLLWRLLPEKEHQVSRLILDAATMALLDLAKDKTPAIRLAATRGLSKIPGAETKAALLQLTRDPTPAVRGVAVVSLGDCGTGALWEASARCLDAVLRVRLRFYEAAEKQDVDDLPQDVLRCGLSDGNAEVRAACLSMIKVWAARKDPDDALRRLVVAAGGDAERALRALLVLPEWATYRDKMAARTPTDAASALIWRISTQLAPELPTEAKPLCQQAMEALLGEHYDVLREMLRLVLEEGEGPTEELAELAMTVLRHCPASCGPVEGTGSFNVFAMAMALLRRLKPKEELQLFLTQLLDDFRYSCQAQAKKKSVNLKEKTMKALYVIEAAFSALGKELEDFDLGCNLLADWLRPAMDQDGEQRALALRCLALYSSSSCEEAVKHWTFFLELMKSDRKDEAMTKTCGLFLLDVLLLYGDQLPPGAALSAFAALRMVLGCPLGGPGGPSEVQRCLAERLITILLYGQWDAETELDASWFLAWLMLEAFRHPASTTPDLKNQAEVNMEAAMQAAFHGRLLCMFGCLGRASLPHATRLSSAMQLLLSTDLWRLGSQISGSPRGVQQRAVHLPRLLRLVCQQLAASCVQQKSSNAQHWAQLWLERIWRPLALLCLEAPEEEQLTELLSATAFALQPSGASNLAPLQKAKNWHRIKQEVEESCQEIVATAEGASFLPMLRDLTRRLEEIQEEDISESWQARAEAQQQRTVLQEQLELRRICTEVQHQNRQIGGKRQMPSDDDSAGHGPKHKKKRVARSLFVGPPGH